jgi:o-succinylbenzoate synthase
LTYDPRGRLSAAPLAGLRRRPFRLALRAPIETASGVIEERAGVVVELLDAEDRRGLGEASPLPELSDGDAGDVLRLLDVHARDILETGRVPEALGGPGAAALRCAIDVAQLDLEGQRRRLPIAALLTDRPRASVEVNAVIGDGSPARVLAQARDAWAAGYRTLKLKIGAAQPEDDRRRVEAIREALPEARLRLDANGGWDEVVAAAALERLAVYDLELVEQPVPAEETEALARLSRAALCRIAADEAVASIEDGRRLLEAAPGALVLKPMRLGGIRPSLELAREAAERGVPCIVTTTFDAGIGVAAALHLAAALPSVEAFADPAHGLATADHLAADIVIEPPRPRGGALAVPPRPGLGVRLDEDALEAAATGAWFALRA